MVHHGAKGTTLQRSPTSFVLSLDTALPFMEGAYPEAAGHGVDVAEKITETRSHMLRGSGGGGEGRPQDVHGYGWHWVVVL